MSRSSAEERFPWVPGPECGAWVAERLEGSIGDSVAEGSHTPALGWLVPCGFDALIRVLHPFTRDRPVGMSWEEYQSRQDLMITTGERSELPEIETESVPWGQAAVALQEGKVDDDTLPCSAETPAGDALSFRLAGLVDRDDELEDVSATGWIYHLPDEGRLDADVLGRTVEVLAAHTETSHRGIAAVWEGYGGLVSGQGVGYFAAIAPAESRLPTPLVKLRGTWQRKWFAFNARRRDFGTWAALQAQLYALLRTPQWVQRRRLRKSSESESVGEGWEYAPLPRRAHMGQLPLGSGVLSRKAAKGARLQLPDRDYVCFGVSVTDFTTDSWKARAPWLSPGRDTQNVQSPNLLWPHGREWFLVSEIDFDSTLIACSRECADALLRAEGIEAVEIDRDTSLWAIS